MKFDRLLAKSRPKEHPDGEPLPPSVFLANHLRDVHDAAVQVLDRTGEDQLRAVGLPPESWCGRLHSVVRLAAALHDLGKANDHFEGMIYGYRKKEQPQGLRHEWVTVLILQQAGWSDWLLPALREPRDWPIVLWCIAGHHPGPKRPSPPTGADSGAGPRMELLLGHTDFRRCLSWLQQTFGLTGPPDTSNQTLWLAGSASAFGTIKRLDVQWAPVWDQLPEQCRRLVAAAKACLIAADVAGSALARCGEALGKRSSWIDRAFQSLPLPEELQRIVDFRLGGHPLRPFQQRVAGSTARIVFVRAGCGTGKTIAGYAWAASRCPGRRLYFCYPTTGTATEGFRDYLLDPEVKESRFGARLFHGRADVDLELILDAGRYEGRDEAAVRLEVLDAWSTPIVSCTVDTVLGLIQNNKRGLYAWPALAGAAFIFDEIHAYDDSLFGALLRFLEAVRGVPVLLMTASLPRGRWQALQERLATLGERIEEVAGPEEIEQLDRYYRLLPSNPTDPLPEVRAELARSGKVLWVCNTVDRAMEWADRAAGMHPLRYHSRFRYCDRVERHSQVVRAFKPESNSGAALAICTQVAELSLDLSATLLVTELAPVPALIQRLGRLNRRAQPPAPGEPPPKPRPFLVIEPRDQEGRLAVAPYTATELEQARQWLGQLGNRPLSQRRLAECWEQFDPPVPPEWVDSTWLDRGPRTLVKELRAVMPGITVVLQEDVPALKRGEKHLPEVALPMLPPPRSLNWRDWPSYKGVPIAPPGTVDYDPKRGARWR